MSLPHFVFVYEDGEPDDRYLCVDAKLENCCSEEMEEIREIGVYEFKGIKRIKKTVQEIS